MNLPRLIIADEALPGSVSPGLVLVYALRRAGVKVKIFAGARPEADIRLLRQLLDEPVVSLDVYASGSIKSLKTLFQKAADPGALNIVLVSLGTRVEEDHIQVHPEVSELAKALVCGIVIVPAASASAVLTTNAVLSVLTALDDAESSNVMGVIFASVKNPREYQLLEQDYGRKAPILSLGYIPKEIERPMPALQDLGGPVISTRVMQVKSAILQLASIPHQVEWEILDALGRLHQDWTPPEEVLHPSKHIKLAIIGDKQFSLEGANARELFQYLGCDVCDYDPWQVPFPMDAEVIYFPHSMTSFYADKLLSHDPFTRGIKQSFAANRLIFAGGASSLLFGQYFITPNGEKSNGLGFFPFHGTFSAAMQRGAAQKVEIRGLSDSVLTNAEEKMRGYALDYFRINNPGNVVTSVWGYRDIRRGTELGTSGWVKSYCFITDLCAELWSNVEAVNRWLSLRKR